MLRAPRVVIKGFVFHHKEQHPYTMKWPGTFFRSWSVPDLPEDVVHVVRDAILAIEAKSVDLKGYARRTIALATRRWRVSTLQIIETYALGQTSGNAERALWLIAAQPFLDAATVLATVERMRDRVPPATVGAITRCATFQLTACDDDGAERIVENTPMMRALHALVGTTRNDPGFPALVFQSAGANFSESREAVEACLEYTVIHGYRAFQNFWDTHLSHFF